MVCTEMAYFRGRLAGSGVVEALVPAGHRGGGGGSSACWARHTAPTSCQAPSTTSPPSSHRIRVTQIELVREPSEQVLRMHVPQEHLLGHAYHTYQLLSPDGTVCFEFQHNVCGRSIYAEGTVDASFFLHRYGMGCGLNG